MNLVLQSGMSGGKKSERTQIDLKQIKLKAIGADASFQVLIIGPSISRKNACIQDILSLVRESRSEKVYVHTTHDEYWPPKSDLVVTSNLSKAVSGPITVIENSEDFDLSTFESILDSGKRNIVALNDQLFRIPRAVANKLTHVIVLGGVQNLRSVWDSFGALIPKFRDFRQMYLACTDEGDRYSDDFFVLRIDEKTVDPNQIFFWGSLVHAQAKNITMNIETSVILNKVHTAETVQIPTPAELKAKLHEEQPVVIETTEPVGGAENESTGENGEGGGENESTGGENEREPRDECIIL